MKVIFEGTPQRIKKEMEHWLSTNQVASRTERVEARVASKLSQHNIALTQDENDILPITLVKQTCQLDGYDWKSFKHDLLTCGVKEKRTNKFRILTNLKLIEED